MGIFKNQLLNVVEWTDEKEGQLFWTVSYTHLRAHET